MDTYPLFLYFDYYVDIPSGGTLTVSYSGATGVNPGITGEWWPYRTSPRATGLFWLTISAATGVLCTDTTTIEVTASIATNTSISCGWLNSHNVSSASAVSPALMRFGNQDNCQFKIVNSLPATEEIVFLIKDLDVGSGSGDRLKIATEDGRWSTVVVREPGVVPGLVIPPPLAGSPNFVVSYEYGYYGGYGSGFSVLWSAKSALSNCLNSRTVISNKTDSIQQVSVDYASSPVSRRAGDDVWFAIIASSARTTVSGFAFLNDTLYTSYDLLSGRGTFYGSQSRIVDAYTSLPDTGSRLQLFRFTSFGLPASSTIPTAIGVYYFIPSAAASDFDAPFVRTASARGVPFHFSVYTTPTGPVFAAYGPSGAAVAPTTTYFSSGAFAALDSALFVFLR